MKVIFKMRVVNFVMLGTFILVVNVYGDNGITTENNNPIYALRKLKNIPSNVYKPQILERKYDFGRKNNGIIFNVYNIIPLLIESINNVSNSSCIQDLLYLKDNIDLSDVSNSWAFKMLDSFGKPESGMLEGNRKWIGDFEECRRVYAPKKNKSNVGGFHGKYCSIQVNVTFLNLTTIGLCLPDTCNSEIFKDINNISKLIQQSEFHMAIKSIVCKSNSMKLSTAGFITLFIMSIFILLVFMGSFITAIRHFKTTETNSHTLHDERGMEYPNVEFQKLSAGDSEDLQIVSEACPSKFKVISGKCDPFLNCFCIFTNGSKLFNTDAIEEQFLCVHGIRFLSMTWIILCHVYLAPMDIGRSVEDAVPSVDNIFFQVVVNGFYAVDSFFVLSGFLLAYFYFQELVKMEGETPWLHFYIHRYLRLTPVYLIVLSFYATVVPVIGSGPFWMDSNIDVNCQKNWWWNLLYINNFQYNSVMCMDWSWYLANEMQFFVISPLFLVTLSRWQKIGYSLLALFVCVSWISGFSITYHFELIPGALSSLANIQKDPTFMTRWMDYNDKIYVKPYTRIAPYVIGIALGYVLFQKKTSNTKANRNTLWIGWFVTVSSSLYLIYGDYHQASSLMADSIFNALSHTLYGLILSWLLFTCLVGQAGVVDKILSWKFFIPLSRLTYCAYLIHPFLINLYFLTMRTTFDFSHQKMVLLYLGLIAVTYFFAMVVSLIFESPLKRVEKLLRSY